MGTFGEGAARRRIKFRDQKSPKTHRFARLGSDKRLSRLSSALAGKVYLDGDRFTAGDLMMTTVLRIIDGKALLEQFPNLVAYKARCQARPAFQAALAAQIADFEEREPV